MVKLPSSCEMTIGNHIYKGSGSRDPKLNTPKGNMFIKDVAKFITTTEGISFTIPPPVEKISWRRTLEEHKFEVVLVITFMLTMINLSILIVKVIMGNRLYTPIEQHPMEACINSPE